MPGASCGGAVDGVSVVFRRALNEVGVLAGSLFFRTIRIPRTALAVVVLLVQQLGDESSSA